MSRNMITKIGKRILELVWGINYKRWKQSLKYFGDDIRLHGWIDISEPQNVSIGKGTSIHSAYIQGREE